MKNTDDLGLTGAIVVDKPSGWTSHDVVAKMRRIAKTKKIGHLGTLDPMATGVLPLLLGRATRLAQFYSESVKTYRATIKFGFATDTYDREGIATSEPMPASFSREELERELESFRGRFDQVPPAVSAKKIQGRPAYELARKKIEFTLAPVSVCVYELNVEEFAGSEAVILVKCAAGTYVRSIAHDVGVRLGCGAHLSALERLQAGEFRIDQARSLEVLGELAGRSALDEALVPAGSLLMALPSETVDEETEKQIRQGQNFRTSPFRAAPEAPYIKAVDSSGRLIAIASPVLPFVYHPICVL